MPRRAFAVAPLVLATACATPQSATTTSSCPADCPRHAEGSVHHGAGKHDGSGPRSGHGDHDGKGPNHGEGKHDGSGPRAGHGDHDGRGPNHGEGRHDGTGPRAGHGDHDGKGPNHGEGKHDGTGPRAGRGGHDGSGAHDGRGGHRGGGMPHRFENALEWAKRFDAPERDAWQKPDDVVAALKLPADALIADVGAGTGYFAVRLARAVPGGRVVALDVENDMVRYVSERAANEGLKNLVARLTPADRADVDAGTDVVLVVDTYHHIDNRTAYFAALKSRLSPRGRVVIVDFKPDSERGPPRDHKLSPDVVKSELAAAGYAQVAQHDFLPDQYVLEFAPKPAG